MAAIMERDIALVTKDSSGNNVIEYPVTRAAQVEDLATFVSDAIKAQAPSPANMKGATASAAGTAGLVPAPAAGAQAKYLRGDGTWQTPPNTTYSNMKGATASAAGTAGLVPAPAAGAQAKYLRGDGTWQTPPTPANDVSLSSNITVTKSTQADIAPSAPSWSSGSKTTRTYFDTVGGLAAGTYTLQNLLQNLVNKSHTHSTLTVTANCNCNCDCGDDCGG